MKRALLLCIFFITSLAHAGITGLGEVDNQGSARVDHINQQQLAERALVSEGQRFAQYFGCIMTCCQMNALQRRVFGEKDLFSGESAKARKLCFPPIGVKNGGRPMRREFPPIA